MNLEIIGNPDEVLRLLAAAGIITVAIATLIGFTGKLGWLFDLFSHFRLQYLLSLAVLTGISIFFASKHISVLGLAFMVVNLVTILPLYVPQRQANEDRPTSRILLSNVLRPSREYEKTARVIRKTRPDIIALVEVSDIWLRELDTELQSYPYCHVVGRDDNFGIALFSRYAISDVQIHYFSEANVPSLIARLDIYGCPLTLIVTHPPPPKSKLKSIHRNQHFGNLANFTAAQPRPCMLLGDFNSTSWSPYLRDLIHRSGLRDSRKGFGIQPTWPAGNPIFMVPIDHVLVSEDITIHKRFCGQRTGSDHLPVITDFSITACFDQHGRRAG